MHYKPLVVQIGVCVHQQPFQPIWAVPHVRNSMGARENIGFIRTEEADQINGGYSCTGIALSTLGHSIVAG